MDINELFKLGMKRDIPRLVPTGEVMLNLGSGNSPMDWCYNLDLPMWNATTDALPFEDASVDTIFAFHFFEHLTGAHAIRLLRECERVLKPEGTINIVVPHRLSQMQWQDLDHKSVWCEETFRNLFSTPYYNLNREEPWHLSVNTNIIIGINERNLALMTQLVKV
jgi:SAM-dependent methyltransferase